MLRNVRSTLILIVPEMLNWPIIIFPVKATQTYMHIMIENEEAGGYKWQLTMGMIGLQGNNMSD